MAYTKVSKDYEKVIYSGGAKNKLKVSFNGIELQNADYYFEKLVRKGRIIPNGNKGFYLDNFVSQTIEATIHDIDLNKIVEPVNISIGTLVNNVYEFVPLGTFNIQDKNKADNDKIILKLEDNAKKFDFNYNGKELIDANGGKVTKKQILNDICKKAKVKTKVTTFIGENDEVSTYDNTIKARKYISLLAEQSGGIATIDRDGDLIFVYLNNLHKHKIPLFIVEKYDKGQQFNVSRVLFEDGVRKFEQGNKNNDTIFINANNPYINSQEQINQIYNKVNGFKIDSLTTGKMYGNPTIDSYDLIEIYDNYLPNNPIIATTLATNELIYKGNIMATYKTTIEISDKRENMSLKPSVATLKRYVNSEIDQVNASIKLQAGEIGKNASKISSLEVNVNGISEKLTQTTTKTQQLESNLKETNNTITINQQNFEKFKNEEYQSAIGSLQDQIDGAIQFWNGEQIPTLNNYPANEWKTENERNNHRADIYTVIKDVNGELKQGKGYRFDKVKNTWQWIELTDNELSAVQAIADEANKRSKENAGSITTLTNQNVEINKTINGISGRVSKTEESITNTNKNLDTTNKNLKDNYYTKTDTNAKFDATNEKITTEVSKVETKITNTNNKIDNIQIGGRNLLPNTSTISSPLIHSEAQLVNDMKLFNNDVFKTNSTWNDACQFNFDKVLVQTTKVHADDILTYSIWAKTDSDIKPNLLAFAEGTGGRFLNGTFVGTVTDEWKQYYFTFKVGKEWTDGTKKIGLFRVEQNTNCSEGKYVYWSSPKLEKGNKATDWTPAPEDIEGELDKTNNSLNNTNNNVSNNQLEIKELSTKVTQNKNSVITEITELTQKVNQNSDNFQNSIDNINNTLENGVEKLKNTLVTIDIEGIKVSTNVSAISTLMSNKEFAIKTNSGQTLAFIGYDEQLKKTVARMDNLTVTNYFTSGYHRAEKMKDKKRTGYFFERSDI